MDRKEWIYGILTLLFSVGLGILMALFINIIMSGVALSEAEFTVKTLFLTTIILGMDIVGIKAYYFGITQAIAAYKQYKDSKVKPWKLKKV